MKQKLFLLLLLINSLSSTAQIELSSGAELGFPVLLNTNNSKLFYSQITAGIRAGLSYKPENTQFFPTLDLSIGTTRLPLKEFGENVAYSDYTYLNLMLKGNLVLSLRNDNTLYVLAGIGFSDLSHRGLGISGHNGDAMQIHLDSTKNINKVFPAIGLGFEYVYGKSVNSKVYLSLGLHFQYVVLFQQRNTYNFTVKDLAQNYTSYSSNLQGRLIMPYFNISLHYLLGKSLVFWKKKDSKYL